MKARYRRTKLAVTAAFLAGLLFSVGVMAASERAVTPPLVDPATGSAATLQVATGPVRQAAAQPAARRSRAS